jgi:hypothetical protein
MNDVTANQLDYVYKKNAVGVVKTDEVYIASISGLNEKIATSNLAFADNVWSESHYLYTGATAACAQPSSIGGFVATNPGFVKLNSVWGTGATPSNPLLIGIAWESGYLNWIPKLFGISYDLFIYAIPSGVPCTPTTIANGTAQRVSPASIQYVFDYTTGVLTFIGVPGPVGPANWNITSKTGTTTTYDLYITQGYLYTGATLTNFTTPVPGTTGYTGPTGYTGYTGYTGPTGSSVTIYGVIFDGGNASISYPIGPVFDCGRANPNILP